MWKGRLNSRQRQRREGLVGAAVYSMYSMGMVMVMFMFSDVRLVVGERGVGVVTTGVPRTSRAPRKELRHLRVRQRVEHPLVVRVLRDVVGDDQPELLAAVQSVGDDLLGVVLDLALGARLVRRGAIVLLPVLRLRFVLARERHRAPRRALAEGAVDAELLLAAGQQRLAKRLDKPARDDLLDLIRPLRVLPTAATPWRGVAS